MADSVGVGFPSSNLQKGHIFHDLDEGSTWVFINGPPRLASSWRLLNGIFSNDPDTSLWGAAQTGATWYNLSLQATRVWDGTQAATVKIANVPVNLYGYKTAVGMQDEFISGGTGSGTIGSLGWIFSGGSISYTTSEVNNIGLLRRDTTAVINTITRIGLNASVNEAISLSTPLHLIWVYRLNTNDADTTVRFGAANSFAGNPPLNGVYIEKLNADTNWFCVSRAAGVETRTDSMVAVSTSFITLQITRNSNGLLFYLNNVQVASITTNIPTAFIVPGNHIINSAAAAKTMDIDYFQLQITGLLRA